MYHVDEHELLYKREYHMNNTQALRNGYCLMFILKGVQIDIHITSNCFTFVLQLKYLHYDEIEPQAWCLNYANCYH